MELDIYVWFIMDKYLSGKYYIENWFWNNFNRYNLLLMEYRNFNRIFDFSLVF